MCRVTYFPRAPLRSIVAWYDVLAHWCILLTISQRDKNLPHEIPDFILPPPDNTSGLSQGLSNEPTAFAHVAHMSQSAIRHETFARPATATCSAPST